MKHGVLAALDQRISISYQMPTMTKEEIASYIKHHLTIVRRSGPLFCDDAVDLDIRAARRTAGLKRPATRSVGDGASAYQEDSRLRRSSS
ncbi:hypothetical protein [Actinacidiphila oryziradicis]|uniref:Uncharacterized protein n=1 Tax=Actinacidiphila oryziradicis TaxID=2571141 RepID=A0A4U0RGY3_9ACTN|nr:hypothetical protein [Actinacidiphila oryziradicis]TJZ94366.1 hypothetical protein FCI23_53955 [Actinacidiphila oryziradicis]